MLAGDGSPCADGDAAVRTRSEKDAAHLHAAAGERLLAVRRRRPELLQQFRPVFDNEGTLGNAPVLEQRLRGCHSHDVMAHKYPPTLGLFGRLVAVLGLSSLLSSSSGSCRW